MAYKSVFKKIENALKIDLVVGERKLTAFVKERVKKSGVKGVVLGLSGGVDSSVAATICANAIGPRNVLGISMPEAKITSPNDVNHARRIANDLDIDFRLVDITPVVNKIFHGISDYKADEVLSSANTRPRIRMCIVYYYANLLNRLVIGSGNRSELRTGYFTKYGDGAVDLLPLGSLYKTQVIKLARYLKLPREIIEKTPTAGLWNGQTDEKELGIRYKKLDMIFAGLDLGLKAPIIAETININLKKVESFIDREHKISHKLRSPDIPKR